MIAASREGMAPLCQVLQRHRVRNGPCSKKLMTEKTGGPAKLGIQSGCPESQCSDLSIRPHCLPTSLQDMLIYAGQESHPLTAPWHGWSSLSEYDTLSRGRKPPAPRVSGNLFGLTVRDGEGCHATQGGCWFERCVLAVLTLKDLFIYYK